MILDGKFTDDVDKLEVKAFTKITRFIFTETFWKNVFTSPFSQLSLS